MYQELKCGGKIELKNITFGNKDSNGFEITFEELAGKHYDIINGEAYSRDKHLVYT